MCMCLYSRFNIASDLFRFSSCQSICQKFSDQWLELNLIVLGWHNKTEIRTLFVVHMYFGTALTFVYVLLSAI